LGGIRPIAIGYTLRRLAAKCVNKYALAVLIDGFTPSQLSVGVSGGCEAAAYTTHCFLINMPLLRLISHMHLIVSIGIQS